jgi:hypothetical protein
MRLPGKVCHKYREKNRGGKYQSCCIDKWKIRILGREERNGERGHANHALWLEQITEVLYTVQSLQRRSISKCNKDA